MQEMGKDLEDRKIDLDRAIRKEARRVADLECKLSESQIALQCLNALRDEVNKTAQRKRETALVGRDQVNREAELAQEAEDRERGQDSPEHSALMAEREDNAGLITVFRGHRIDGPRADY